MNSAPFASPAPPVPRSELVRRTERMSPRQALERFGGLDERALDLFDEVPEHLKKGLMRWALFGTPVDSHLTAALSNSLYDALSSSRESVIGLPFTVDFIRHGLPGAAYGSSAALCLWEDRGGLIGIDTSGDEPVPEPTDEDDTRA